MNLGYVQTENILKNVGGGYSGYRQIRVSFNQTPLTPIQSMGRMHSRAALGSFSVSQQFPVALHFCGSLQASVP